MNDRGTRPDSNLTRHRVANYAAASNQPKLVQASMELNHFRIILGASWDRSAAVGAGVLLSLQVYSPGPGLYVGPSPVV